MFSSKQLSVLLILSLFFALFNVQGALANENNAKGIGLELGAVGGFPIGVGASARVSYPFDIEDLSFEAGVNSALFPAFYFFGGELFGSVDIDGRLYFSEAFGKIFVGPRVGTFLGGELSPYVGATAGTELMVNEHFGVTLKIDLLSAKPSGIGQVPISASGGVSLRYVM